MVIKMSCTELFLIILLAHFPTRILTFMKHNYRINVDTVSTCPDNEKLDFPISNLNYLKINRTHKSLSYDITYTYPLDDKVGGGLTVERWGDGGWINIPFMPLRQNICEYMLKYFREIWIQAVSTMELEDPGRCPIPKGSYSIKNQILDFSNVNIPFWSGRLRLTLYAQRKGSKSRTLCMIYTFNVVENV